MKKNTKEIAENLQAVLDGEEKSFAFEYPCHSPQEERWFLLQVSAMRGADGGAVISHIDISDRKKAEHDLRQNKEQLNFILDVAQLGVWRLNLKDSRAIRSPLHDRIFGYKELLPEWTFEMFLEHILRKIAKKFRNKFSSINKHRHRMGF